MEEEYKYKIGDKVIVIKNPSIDASYYMEDGIVSNSFVSEMVKYQIVTIEKYDMAQYKVKEDNGEWGWTDGMFVGLISTSHINTEINSLKLELSKIILRLDLLQGEISECCK